MTFRSLRLAAMAGLLTAMAAPVMAADADPVVATVDGHQIHRSDLMKAKDALGKHGQVPLERVYGRLLDQMITEQLILDAAVKQKVEDAPEFASAMAEAKRQAMIQVYLAKRADADIPESAIRERYQQMQAGQPKQDEVHVRHILVNSEDEAKAVIADLESGVSFADEAKAKSKDPAAKTNGGDGGYITRDKAVPEFAEAAFKLKPGEYTKVPVKSTFGWHVIMVEDRRQVPPPSYEQMRTDIKGELFQKDLDKVIAELQKDAKVTRFNADGTPMPPNPHQH